MQDHRKEDNSTVLAKEKGRVIKLDYTAHAVYSVSEANETPPRKNQSDTKGDRPVPLRALLWHSDSSICVFCCRNFLSGRK
jgi:hypothetical protein